MSRNQNSKRTNLCNNCKRFVETLTGEFAQKVIQMQQELLARGVPPLEVKRAIIAYFSQPEPPPAESWPGPVTGLDLAPKISTVKVLDTGQPLTDFTGLPKDVQPYPTPNRSPYGIGTTQQPYPSFFTPDGNNLGNLSNVYKILNHPYPYESLVWNGFASKPSSEPSMHGEHGFNVEKSIPEWRYPIEQSQMHPVKIPDIIIPPSGAIMESCGCAKSLQEAFTDLRSEFAWLDDDYISRAKELVEKEGGYLYLVRAASETITDHRAEGEPYRRKLSSEELNSMSRTAIGTSMDINHQPHLQTQATILDVEFDKNRKEMQMMVVEKDPQINDAIRDRIITAVSINGGMPRNESIEPCDHNCSNNCELCLVPKGVVLGELDGIGMTWVVTDPRGMYWNGHFVPKAEPGVKTTSIQRL